MFYRQVPECVQVIQTGSMVLAIPAPTMACKRSLVVQHLFVAPLFGTALACGGVRRFANQYIKTKPLAFSTA